VVRNENVTVHEISRGLLVFVQSAVAIFGLLLACLYCLAVLTTLRNKKLSYTAEEPRDTLCQLKTCRLLHNCTQLTVWKGLQYANDLEGQSRYSELPTFYRC